MPQDEPMTPDVADQSISQVRNVLSDLDSGALTSQQAVENLTALFGGASREEGEIYQKPWG